MTRCGRTNGFSKKMEKLHHEICLCDVNSVSVVVACVLFGGFDGRLHSVMELAFCRFWVFNFCFGYGKETRK